MTEINRRNFLTRALASGGALLLAGCDRLSGNEWFVDVLGSAEKLNSGVQHLITSRTSMAQEFSEADLSPMFRSNGTAKPKSSQYQALAANGFADYRLDVTGLVETPRQFSLAELRALEARTQITRHDCVESWSAIGKWKGAKLSALLDAVRPKGEARFWMRCGRKAKRASWFSTAPIRWTMRGRNITRASTSRTRSIRRLCSPTI